jgi:hypothetical protein
MRLPEIYRIHYRHNTSPVLPWQDIHEKQLLEHVSDTSVLTPLLHMYRKTHSLREVGPVFVTFSGAIRPVFGHSRFFEQKINLVLKDASQWADSGNTPVWGSVKLPYRDMVENVVKNGKNVTFSALFREQVSKMHNFGAQSTRLIELHLSRGYVRGLWSFGTEIWAKKWPELTQLRKCHIFSVISRTGLQNA